MGWGVGKTNLYFTMKVVVVPFFSCRKAIPGDAAAARPAVIEDDSHAMEGKYQSPSVVYFSPREKGGAESDRSYFPYPADDDSNFSRRKKQN